MEIKVHEVEEDSDCNHHCHNDTLQRKVWNIVVKIFIAYIRRPALPVQQVFDLEAKTHYYLRYLFRAWFAYVNCVDIVHVHDNANGVVSFFAAFY